MSNDTIPVSINIMEKEYKISCPAGEHESLVMSAQHVNDSMQKIRAGGKALGAERIAVMAAINIAHELHNTSSEVDADTVSRIDSLQQSVDAALKSFS